MNIQTICVNWLYFELFLLLLEANLREDNLEESVAALKRLRRDLQEFGNATPEQVSQLEEEIASLQRLCGDYSLIHHLGLQI